jgi:hypothetical protein
MKLRLERDGAERRRHPRRRGALATKPHFPVDGVIFGVPLAPAFAYKPLLALKDHFCAPGR